MINLSSPFFSGIGGSGMSAIAQFLVAKGSKVFGSDCSFDRGQEEQKRCSLKALGMNILPQDGSAISEDLSCLIVSTAIEENNPEIQKAREMGIPIHHRSDVLAYLAKSQKTIAISGTSGKSTVTGMAWHVLRAGGLDPSLVTGGNLVSLQNEGLVGNAYGGKGEWLLVEADESDGSLIKYHPALGVILNIEKDHKEISELIPLFSQFQNQSQQTLINQEDPHTKALLRKSDATFSMQGWLGCPLKNLELKAWGSRFQLGGITFEMEHPGMHNVFNAICAVRIGEIAGVCLEKCAIGLKEFKGIERRAIRTISPRGCHIVDDFAHNPAKIQACLEAIQNAIKFTKKESGVGQLIAIFHPHGFAPMRLMRRELVAVLAQSLRPGDTLVFPEIFFAGGTVDRSISSADLIQDFNALRPGMGHFFPDKDMAAQFVKSIAKKGDWVLSMGARDPSLGDWAKKLRDEL